MDISCVGVVIKEQMHGENDKLLTILTPEGKVYAYAKGVKKISSKNAPACQLFVYSEYEFIKKNGRLSVKTAVSKELFYNMRSDMTRYALACYFAEVISHITTENNDETETLRLFLNTLYAIANKPEIPLWQIKGAFELKLMCICGFMPDFSTCFVCGCETEIMRENIFSFEESTLICENCRKGNVAYSCTISQEVCNAMKYVSLSSVTSFLSFKLTEESAPEFSFACENYLIHKTERTYETLKIYKSIINSLGEK